MTEKPVIVDASERRHPSYGMISIVRVNSSHTVNLFGNNIPSHSIIDLRISRASIHRNLYHDDIFSRETIIEVSMSANQFADMITSLNTSGTPCTITWLNGERVEDPDIEDRRAKLDKEFKDEFGKLLDPLNEYYRNIEEMLSKTPISKKDRKAIMDQLSIIQRKVSDTVPFIEKRYTEETAKIVTEAKAEISSWVDEKARRMGIDGLKASFQIELNGTEEKKEDERRKD